MDHGEARSTDTYMIDARILSGQVTDNNGCGLLGWLWIHFVFALEPEGPSPLYAPQTGTITPRRQSTTPSADNVDGDIGYNYTAAVTGRGPYPRQLNEDIGNSCRYWLQKHLLCN